MIAKSAVVALVLSLGPMSSAAFAAEGEHKHEAKVFASAAEGVGALAATIAEAKAKTAAGNLEALHDISEDLHGIAEGLEQRAGDVKAENRERFAFNVKQVNALHEQLEIAHDSKNKSDIDRVLKRLDDVHGRLAALSAP
jgi:hypothetical protein